MLKARNGQVLNCNGVTTRRALWKLYPNLANKLSSHKFTFPLLFFTSASMAEPSDRRLPQPGQAPRAVALRSDVGVRADSRGRPVTDCGHNGHSSAMRPPAAWRAVPARWQVPTVCFRIPPWQCAIGPTRYDRS